MLKGAFVGFGRMGITHFSILNNHPGVEVVGIADPSRAMRAMMDRYLTVPAWSDYRKMLDEARPDFVVISTPSALHAEIIREALDRGLHVFAEKPLTLTADESRDIVARLEGRSLVNQVGYVNRFNEVFHAVKELLDEGILGDVRGFRSEMDGATVIRETANWRGKRESGGGCLYEFASHAIDLSVYMFGPPERVGGSVMERVFSSAVEDLVSTTLFYPGGLTGTLLVNWSDASFRKPANVFSVFGTRGRIVADKHAYRIWLREPDEQGRFESGWNTRYITEFARPVRFYVRGNEFTHQLDAFVESIDAGRPAQRCSFADALHTDVLIDAITADAEAGGGGPSAARPSPRSAPEEHGWAPQGSRRLAILTRLLDLIRR